MERAHESDDLRLLQLAQHSFYLQKGYQKEWCENTMLHVSVPDVDAWFEFVANQFDKNDLDQLGRLSGQPKLEGYGRVFYVWDPAGVLIHFAQFTE